MLDQLPLTADGEDDLEERGANQAFGRDGGAAVLGVHLVKQRIQCVQRLIDRLAKQRTKERKGLKKLLEELGKGKLEKRLRRALDDYHLAHERFRLDPAARNVQHTYVTPAEDRRSWRVQQMLVDPAEANDWVAEFEVDLVASRATGEPVLGLRRLGSLV